jgi:hypothetical protein
MNKLLIKIIVDLVGLNGIFKVLFGWNVGLKGLKNV